MHIYLFVITQKFYDKIHIKNHFGLATQGIGITIQCANRTYKELGRGSQNVKDNLIWQAGPNITSSLEY